MALGGEVDDAIDMFILHQFIDPFKVADVHLDKAVVRLVLYVLQVGEVAGIGQLVEVDDLIFGIFVHKKTNNVTADETSATGDDDGSFHVSMIKVKHGSHRTSPLCPVASGMDKVTFLFVSLWMSECI